eukprot:14609621-Ditylum_brightwellii.AAC.1
MAKHAKTGEDIKISFKSVLNPNKTLGYLKAPAGTAATQTTVLKEKAEAYALQIIMSPLSPAEA